MKKSKIIIPALGMLVMSTAATVTGTVAWFSMNKTVTASGMMVKAQAEGSLVITSTANLPSASDKATDLNFNNTTAARTLYASTHDWSIGTATGLKRVANAENINPETGSRINNVSGTELVYEGIPSSTTSQYYIDYACLIAGDGSAFEHQDITVKLNGSTTGGTINQAISVDFYGESVTTAKAAAVSSANYKGTLNIAGKVNNAEDNGTTALTSFKISDITVPQSGTTAAYAITMRVFFDGNLIETAGTNSYTVYTAATGTKPASNAPYYYLDDKGNGIADVASDASVTNYYVVNNQESTFRYARTTSVANIQDTTLKCTYTAGPHNS